MTVMDAVTICNILKRGERTSHIPMDMLMGGVDEEQVLKSFKSSTDDFIVKPFIINN